jgi:hypothetical protein
MENKENWLTEFGLLVWKHKTHKGLFLHRHYHWVDRVTLVDEANGRRVVDSFKHSTFDYSAWELITKEEDSKVKDNYTEIYLHN